MIDQEIFTKDKQNSFCIAGLMMDVIVPEKFDLEQLMPSLKPFRCDSTDQKNAICSLRIVAHPIEIEPGSTKILNEVYGMLGHWFCLMETEHFYVVDIQYIENGNLYRMVSNKTFTTATAYMDESDKNAHHVLSLFLMIVFAHSAVLHQTILIHASVIEKEQQGYVFLGKSGMGKSTHSSLWLRHIEETDLLNDDNPAIRIEEDGSVYVYGTPWSGKTPCYKNRKAQLQAIVRLQQAHINRFTWKNGVEALIALLPSCLSMRWNELLYRELCDLLEEIIHKVKIGYLECLPDKEAAQLCYKEINNYKL